nr:ATP synthase F0 subunit 8 [Lucania parva]
MPQLMPEPWFVIFLITWLVLLTIIPMQIVSLSFPYDPGLQTDTSPKAHTWDWQWL